MTYDDRKSALIIILPADTRQQCLMSMHWLEPPPGANQEQQDSAYFRLRDHIQKTTELLSQYNNLGKSKSDGPINHVDVDPHNDTNPPDYPEPSPDDVVGQALFAVYKKGWNRGKGGGRAGVWHNNGHGAPENEVVAVRKSTLQFVYVSVPYTC